MPGRGAGVNAHDEVEGVPLLGGRGEGHGGCRRSGGRCRGHGGAFREVGDPPGGRGSGGAASNDENSAKEGDSGESGVEIGSHGQNDLPPFANGILVRTGAQNGRWRMGPFCI